MSNKSIATIATMGIDIGKNSFHVIGLDRRGAIVLRQKWSRGQVEARVANMPRCLIGMETCVGAHHLSRKLQAHGHDARLMPAKYVRPYSKGGVATPHTFAHDGVFDAATSVLVLQYAKRRRRRTTISTNVASLSSSGASVFRRASITDKIEANFKSGVLTVTLPKTVEAQKAERKITVKAA